MDSLIDAAIIDFERIAAQVKVFDVVPFVHGFAYDREAGPSDMIWKVRIGARFDDGDKPPVDIGAVRRLAMRKKAETMEMLFS